MQSKVRLVGSNRRPLPPNDVQLLVTGAEARVLAQVVTKGGSSKPRFAQNISWDFREAIVPPLPFDLDVNVCEHFQSRERRYFAKLRVVLRGRYTKHSFHSFGGLQ
ncbi:hypothetical protein T265_01799 [Opisthorchis viverrini]|uniref:C2 domain-containing protein n=1 Tax=Opisthorchis viverrini TaxID=6198 RepID=A0A074ZX25_OPIVI|nr:hypothetical protein T265_01799 [Opisthorchis viverrini]KER32018.1 hypothetical protein T265_01799 [Opisthorchis viverrini]